MALAGPAVVDRDDAGMVELAAYPRSVDEALGGLAVVWFQLDLHRHPAGQFGFDGPVDGGVSPLAADLFQKIAVETLGHPDVRAARGALDELEGRTVAHIQLGVTVAAEDLDGFGHFTGPP